MANRLTGGRDSRDLSQVSRYESESKVFEHSSPLESEKYKQYGKSSTAYEGYAEKDFTSKLLQQDELPLMPGTPYTFSNTLENDTEQSNSTQELKSKSQYGDVDFS